MVATMIPIAHVDATDQTHLGEQFLGTCPAEPTYEVDEIMERWGKNTFLLRWKFDGTYWWVPRKNIDPGIVEEFESRYQLVDAGVQRIIGTRLKKTKNVRIQTKEYLAAWIGRPEEEASWISEKRLHHQWHK
ncbi:hypothetical protein G7054_g11302 [Neopestalotiopsis clavispora]|nr:hypothetical protein G7054_g11302 [Neopestalotiopsis clavispora]